MASITAWHQVVSLPALDLIFDTVNCKKMYRLKNPWSGLKMAMGCQIAGGTPLLVIPKQAAMINHVYDKKYDMVKANA